MCSRDSHLGKFGELTYVLSYARADFTAIRNIKAAIKFQSYTSEHCRRMVNLSRINPYSNRFHFKPGPRQDHILCLDNSPVLCVSVVALTTRSSLLSVKQTGTAGENQFQLKVANCNFFPYEWQRYVSALGVIAHTDKVEFNVFDNNLCVQTRMTAVPGTRHFL